jgi:hypothetical protein
MRAERAAELFALGVIKVDRLRAGSNLAGHLALASGLVLDLSLWVCRRNGNHIHRIDTA